MASTVLINGVTYDSTPVTGNGTFDLFQSAAISNSQAREALRVVIKYEDNLPDPETQSPVYYSLGSRIDSSDGIGNWYPFHFQYKEYVKAEQGQTHILLIQPNLFSLDEGVPFELSDGTKIVSVESRKQASLPDDFRITIFVNERGFGTSGAFQSVKITSHYEVF